jgi:hypothetical protein
VSTSEAFPKSCAPHAGSEGDTPLVRTDELIWSTRAIALARRAIILRSRTFDAPVVAANPVHTASAT